MARELVKVRKVAGSIVVTLTQNILSEVEIAEGDRVLVEALSPRRIVLTKERKTMPNSRRVELELELLQCRKAGLESQLEFAHAQYNRNMPCETGMDDPALFELRVRELECDRDESRWRLLKSGWNYSSFRALEQRWCYAQSERRPSAIWLDVDQARGNAARWFRTIRRHAESRMFAPAGLVRRIADLMEGPMQCSNCKKELGLPADDWVFLRVGEGAPTGTSYLTLAQIINTSRAVFCSQKCADEKRASDSQKRRNL